MFGRKTNQWSQAVEIMHASIAVAQELAAQLEESERLRSDAMETLQRSQANAEQWRHLFETTAQHEAAATGPCWEMKPINLWVN